MDCHVRAATWRSGLTGVESGVGLAGLKPGGYTGMPKVGNCRRSALVNVI